MGDGGSFWVFGYGSLMWRPGFDHLRAIPARLSGFHRRLCVYSHHYRGTPEKPGLVFGLDRGGACDGVAFEVAAQHWPAALDYLIAREKITDVYREVFKPVMAKDVDGPVQALAFVANRAHAQYAGKLADDDLLRLIAQGHGISGACKDYVQNTLDHLRQRGIHDAELERVGRLMG